MKTQVKPERLTAWPGSQALLWDKLGEFFRLLAQTFRLMVGVPDYDKYVAHARATHPECPVMTYEEFFKNRQDARYSGRGPRGCC
jgi:uncharacterized short protein YbdD (DUF466 family)